MCFKPKVGHLCILYAIDVMHVSSCERFLNRQFSRKLKSLLKNLFFYFRFRESFSIRFVVKSSPRA
nr:MAG TPA_asm: hypothetical protein [Caudoviricetes sp.]